MTNVNHVHGESSWKDRTATPENKAWSSMIERCENPSASGYKWYGGKGIKVCDRWRNSYIDFLEDMGRKPTPRHTLGRLNGKGDYDPLNCEWQTWTKQARSRSNTKLTSKKVREIRMLYRGGYNQYDLAKEFGIAQSTVSQIVNYQRWKDI